MGFLILAGVLHALCGLACYWSTKVSVWAFTVSGFELQNWGTGQIR